MQIGQQIEFEGQIWIIRGIGVTNDEGKTFVHLAHLTKKIGIHPVQINVWF